MARGFRYGLLIVLGVIWPNGGWSDARPRQPQGRATAPSPSSSSAGHSSHPTLARLLAGLGISR